MTMTPQQAEVYRKLKEIPATLKPSSQQVLQDLAEADTKKRAECAARRETANEPLNHALRAALAGTPGVREALENFKRPQPPSLPVLPQAPLLKEPIVRLGSIHLVEAPPFLALTGESKVGPDVLSESADGNIANMTANITAGTTASGSGTSWAALGATIFAPPGTTQMQFMASLDMSWVCDWFSNCARYTQGDVAVGQVVNLFDTSGAFLTTIVNTRIVQFSYDTNNPGSGDQTGANSGFALRTGLIPLPSPAIVQCFAQISATGNADGSSWWFIPHQSGATSVIGANLTSFTVDLF